MEHVQTQSHVLPAAWTRRRIRLWLAMALVAAWLPVIAVPFRDFFDFSAFYVAAHFIFTPDVIHLDPIIRAQAMAGLPISPYHYTPIFALLFAPLSWLPFWLAGFLNMALMFAALLLAAGLGARLFGLSRREAIIGALAWGPAANSVLGGQNATFALLLIVIAGVLMQRADLTGSRLSAIAAGVTLSVLAYKPQFGAPVAGLALLRERWLVVAATIVGLGAHYLIGVMVAGGNFAWPVDWLVTVSGTSSMDLKVNGWQAVSLPALFARVPLSPFGDAAPAGLQGLSVFGYVIAGLAILLCVPAMRNMPLPRALALSVSLGLLIMPQAWVYNATLLLPALAVLALDARRRGWPNEDRWMFVALYAAGLAWPLGGVIGFTSVLIVVVLMPALLVIGARSSPKPPTEMVPLDLTAPPLG